MSFRPHHFGRYTILDPIAVGGMAEIYRARLTNTGDAPDRIIIIKKIIQSLSNNSDFVDMFEAEIKITVGLSHPNIVQIYDYGRVDGVSFLAMEYVEGKNLRQFLKRLISMKSMFSIDMSCHIVSQVCNALSYAHAFRDRMTGEHIGLVHRDVSPQNVMISYDGGVKLFDFGIAKAKSASEATQAGVIKGKPSYLSPEQISGEVLDGRSDVFSLGIVLWEMLTAKRLFVADNDMAILRMIQSSRIEAPSTYNPSIPQTLDAIVLKSLARDRDKRYRTGEEMQRDLHRFLYSFNPGFNPADLSYYATELFKKEIQEDRERLRASLKLTPEPFSGGNPNYDAQEAIKAKGRIPSDPSKSGMTEGLVSSNQFNREVMEDMLMTGTANQAPATQEPDIEIIERSKKLREPEAAPLPAAQLEKTGVKNVAPEPTAAGTTIRPKTKTPVVGAARVAKQAKAEDAVIPPWLNQGSPNSAGKGSITSINDAIVDRRRVRPGSRALQIDRLTSSGNGLSIAKVPVLLTILGILFGVIFLGPRFAPDVFRPLMADGPLAFLLPTVDGHNPPPVVKQPEPVNNSPVRPSVAEREYAEITINANVEDYSVFVNGREVRIDENRIRIPVGIDVQVVIQKEGYDPKNLNTRVESKAPAAWNVQLAKVELGRLVFLTTPGADITLRSPGRQPTSLYTPLRNYELPVGEYEATIENTRLNHRSKVIFRVEKGKTTTIEKTLN